MFEQLPNKQMDVYEIDYSAIDKVYYISKSLMYEELISGYYDEALLWHENLSTFCTIKNGTMFIGNKKYTEESSITDTHLYTLLGNGYDIMTVLAVYEL